MLTIHSLLIAQRYPPFAIDLPIESLNQVRLRICRRRDDILVPSFVAYGWNQCDLRRMINEPKYVAGTAGAGVRDLRSAVSENSK